MRECAACCYDYPQVASAPFLWRISAARNPAKKFLGLTEVWSFPLVRVVTFLSLELHPSHSSSSHIRCQHFPSEWLNGAHYQLLFHFPTAKLVNHKLGDTTCELSPNSLLLCLCKLVCCCSMGALIIKKFFPSILLYAQ